MEEKKDIWDLEIIQIVTERVVFEEPLTKEEAMEAYHKGWFEDVIGVGDQETLKILSTE